MFEESKSFTQTDLIVGFDLGTTNSVVSLYTGAIPEVLHLDGSRIIPSFVEVGVNGDVDSIGIEAKNKRTDARVVSSFKKHMGTDKIIIDALTAEDISTLFIGKVFEKIRDQHPHLASVNSVVVSVPAYFNINQINSTKNAFRRNGIKVIDVSIEPVSAALVYKELKGITDTILVFDLGGGTFDAVLIANTAGVPEESVKLYKAAGIKLSTEAAKLEIKDIDGCNILGGDDIDEEAIRLYRSATGSDRSQKDLLVLAESVKHSGHSSDDFLYDYVVTATGNVMQRCMHLVDRMLNRNHIQKVHCVLCGGSTKSPLVKSELKKRFKMSNEIDPDLSVSVGNSMFASKSQIIQRTPKHIGILINKRFKTVIQKGSIIPTANTVHVKNMVPGDTDVDLKIYQTNSLIENPEHISTMEVSGLSGHDVNGYSVISVKIEYLLDGTINVCAESEGKRYQTTLSYVDTSRKESEPAAVSVIRKTNAKIKDKELTRLLEEWDNTHNKALIPLMHARLVKCRKK